MSLTRIQAIDDMLALLKTAWVTTASQDGSRIQWENVGNKSVPPDGEYPWCRVTIRHNSSRQRTLAGATGRRIFTRKGTIVVQVFEVGGRGLPATTDLAKIILDAYEGVTSPGGVWFRDVTLNEIGQDGSFFQTNIVAGFEYDEVK